MTDLSQAEKFLLEERTDEAIAELVSILREDSASDRAFYLLGNAYRKKGDWQRAMNNYLEAIHINPDSPAANALKMAEEILNFYNKDMYNQ